MKITPGEIYFPVKYRLKKTNFRRKRHFATEDSWSAEFCVAKVEARLKFHASKVGDVSKKSGTEIRFALEQAV